MKSTFFRAVMVSGFLGCWVSHQVQGQPAPAPAPAPQPGLTTAAGSPAGTPSIKFDSLVWNFGRVPEGEKVRHDFIFTNVGTATLEITEVKPGCGCTTAGQWDRKVEPGKTGKIPIEFNTAKYGSTVTKTTRVTSNDPNRPSLSLQITGNPWKPIQVSPTMAVFHLAAGAETNVTKVVRVVSNLDEPITLSDAESAHEQFRVEVKTTQPGKKFELHITAMPPFKAPSTSSAITVKTSSPKMPKITTTAYVVVQKPVMVSPASITLSPDPLATEQSKTLRVRRMDPGTLKLSEAKANVPGIDVQVTERGQGRYFNVVAKFATGFQVPPFKKVEITIKTDHPHQPLIRIPVVRSAYLNRKPKRTSAPVRVPPSGSVPGAKALVPPGKGKAANVPVPLRQ